MSETVVKTSQKLQDFFQDIQKVLLPISEAAIIAACPEMDLPVVKQISEGIETAVANELVKIADKYADFAVQDENIDAEDRLISAELKAVIDAEKLGDKDALSKAIAAYQVAVSELSNNDLSTSH
jgi:hypothetical protein